MKNAKGGRFGRNPKFKYVCMYIGGLMLMCVGDVCTCKHPCMHACMYACVMPYQEEEQTCVCCTTD